MYMLKRCLKLSKCFTFDSVCDEDINILCGSVWNYTELLIPKQKKVVPRKKIPALHHLWKLLQLGLSLWSHVSIPGLSVGGLTESMSKEQVQDNKLNTIIWQISLHNSSLH